MKLRVFSVFDVKAKAYLPPFFMPEQGQAIRVFSDCVNNVEHQFGSHPGDYSLFEIGDFDDNHGQLVPCNPTMVVQGLECVVAVPKSPQLDLIEVAK